MDPEKQREISVKGGASPRRESRTFFRDRKLAAECGRRGGKALKPEQRSFSTDPELARRAGSAGGKKGGGARKRKTE